jgi:hypothetical protein
LLLNASKADFLAASLLKAGLLIAVDGRLGLVMLGNVGRPSGGFGNVGRPSGGFGNVGRPGVGRPGVGFFPGEPIEGFPFSPSGRAGFGIGLFGFMITASA